MQTMKLDPIIAVKDVKASATWYGKIFGFQKAHGGSDFAVLVTESKEVILCLHKWGAHKHPTLKDQNIIAVTDYCCTSGQIIYKQ